MSDGAGVGQTVERERVWEDEKRDERDERDESEGPTATDRTTDALNVVVAVGLAGTGLVFGAPVLVAAAVIPLVYTGAAALTGSPATAISVTRDLAPGDDARATTDTLSGEPGASVQVRLHVRNESRVPLVDLRVVDGTPRALPVVDGTPRACLTLDPGDEQTVEYTVELQRGEYTFEPASVRARDIAGTVAVDWEETPPGEQTLTCSPTVRRAPVGEGSNEYAGDVPTDDGGSGLEFHSVREYEPGDPVRSIDWRRYANTRELASVEYKAERAARILTVVDTRQSQFRSPDGSELSVAELTLDAAERTVTRLLDEGHPTGLATIDAGGLDLVAPGTGTAVRNQIGGLLARQVGASAERSGPAPGEQVMLGTSTDEEAAGARRLQGDPAVALQETTSTTTQVLLFSGFLDDLPLDLVTQLCSLGYSVTVVSPSLTDDPSGREAGVEAASLSARLAGLARENRLTKARRGGATVLSWNLDESVGTVLDRAVREVAQG